MTFRFPAQKGKPPLPTMARLRSGDGMDFGPIDIEADTPDPTNAALPSRYRLFVQEGSGARSLGNIVFQRGSVQGVGRNGVSEDALILILRHRLQCHQKGAYSIEPNDEALKLLEQVQELLRVGREARRMAYGK